MKADMKLKTIKTDMKLKLLFISIAILLLGSYANAVKNLDDDLCYTESLDTLMVDIDNPYESITWGKVNQIRSTSHVHIEDQVGLDRAVKMGYRHLPISNYYPSTPYYPVDSIRVGQFRVKQEFGVMRLLEGEDPQYIEGPINWSQVIMDEETGWYDSLTKEQQQELPFKIGGFIYTNVPEDIIFSPNAEHHAFTNANVHINSLGSLYSSGTFDKRNNFKTFYDGAGYSFGTGLTWQDSFEKMLDQLLFEDGGGVTINHPTMTKTEQSLIEEMLDFDPRVLGIEVFNQGVWDLKMWDNVLKTGRRCLGFFVPDWGVQTRGIYKGFNILLMDDFTEHNCLKAYRQGAFYGSENGGDLIFNEISFKTNQLTVGTNSTSTIAVITDKGRSEIENTLNVVYEIPLDDNNKPTIKYVRFEAENNNDRIFSQPIRFTIK